MHVEVMPTTSSTLAPADLDTLLARRRSALAAYNEAHHTDGMTAASWTAIADLLASVAVEILTLTGRADRYVSDRAVDAAGWARSCETQVIVARRQWGTSCIEVAS